MSEKQILQNAFRFFGKHNSLLLPPGDDCAAQKLPDGKILLLAADQVIEGVHYKPNESPAKIARKALARNLSDIAACGGASQITALCTIALSEKSTNDTIRWFDEFFKALGKYARDFNVIIAGGDIAKIAKKSQTVISVSLTAISSAKKLIRRSGAKNADLIFCTGELGNSFLSGHHLNFKPRLEEAEFLSECGYANSMIDISDGLLKDALALADASGGKIILHRSKIPLRKGADIKSALTEGEDYELLFSVPENKSEKLIQNWPFKTKLSKIGRFIYSANSEIVSETGENLSAKFAAGYDHFSKTGS